MADEKLEIVITLKDRITRGLSSAGKALDIMRGSANRLKGAIFNLRNAMVGMATFFVGQKLISYADEQAKAVIGMETALRSMGNYTPELSQELQRIASDIQGLTNYGDEAILMGQKFLITYKDIGLDVMPRVSMAMADLAALMGGDMRQAANMLGKASMGMTGELRRVGITVDANVYKMEGFLGVLKAIENQSKGQAVAMRVATGSLKAMTNSFLDVKEKAGDFLKIMLEPQFKRFLGWFDDLNAKLTRLQEEGIFEEYAEKTAKKVIDSFKSMALVVARIYDIVSPILKSFKTLFVGLWDWFSTLPPWVQTSGIIVAIMGGVKAKIAIAALTVLYGKIADIADLIQEFKGRLSKDLGIRKLQDDIADLEAQLDRSDSWFNFWSAAGVENVEKRLVILRRKLKEIRGEEVAKVIDSEAISEGVKSAEVTLKSFFDATEKAQIKAAAIDDLIRDILQSYKKAEQEASTATLSTAEKIRIALEKSASEAEGSISKTFASFIKQAKQAYGAAKLEAGLYAQKVLEVEERIRLIRMSTEDKIRDLQRKTMTESKAYRDERKQAEEKLSAAQRAFRKGDFELAKSLSQESEALYAGLAREITKTVDGETIIVKSMQASVKIATKGLQAVGDLSIRIEEEQKRIYKDLEQEAITRMNVIQAKIDELVKKRELDIEIKLKDVLYAQSIINSLTKDETKHITVEISTVSSGTRGYQTGGVLPGYGGGDRVPVLAESGEGFVRKEAIRKYGKDFFNAYNSLSFPISALTKTLRAKIGGIVTPSLGLSSGFQTGGIVPSLGIKNMGAIEIKLGSKSYPVIGKSDVLTELKLAIKQENMLRSN